MIKGQITDKSHKQTSSYLWLFWCSKFAC